MSKTHTPGPWKIDESRPHLILLPEKAESGHGSKYVVCGGGNNEANAERIVACVNAMQGIENPQFKWLAVIRNLTDTIRERNELARWKSEAIDLYKPIHDFEHPELKLCDSRVETIMRLVAERDQFLGVLEETYNLALQAKKEFKILIDALKSIADMQPVNQAGAVACFHQAKLGAEEALEKLAGDGQNP
jgi:hypothetical protein